MMQTKPKNNVLAQRENQAFAEAIVALKNKPGLNNDDQRDAFRVCKQDNLQAFYRQASFEGLGQMQMHNSDSNHESVQTLKQASGVSSKRPLTSSDGDSSYPLVQKQISEERQFTPQRLESPLEMAAGIYEEKFIAAPVNETKQRQAHPENKEEVIPSEHPPFVVQLDTRMSQASCHVKCSPRLNRPSQDLISEAPQQIIKMEQRKIVKSPARQMFGVQHLEHRDADQDVVVLDGNSDQVSVSFGEELICSEHSSNLRQQVKRQDVANREKIHKRARIQHPEFSMIQAQFAGDQRFNHAVPRLDQDVKSTASNQIYYQRALGTNEEMMQNSSKAQLRQEIFELRKAIKQKDSLIHLMSVEIQTLQFKLEKETQQRMLLQKIQEQQSDFEQINSDLYEEQKSLKASFERKQKKKVYSTFQEAVNVSSDSDLLVEETKREKQVMMLPVSTGRAAKNAQRLRQSDHKINPNAMRTNQMAQNDQLPDPTAYPSASPSSQPLQVSQQSQLIGLVNIQGPPHEQKRNATAPQSRSSSESNSRRHNHTDSKVIPNGQRILEVDEESKAQNLQRRTKFLHATQRKHSPHFGPNEQKGDSNGDEARQSKVGKQIRRLSGNEECKRLDLQRPPSSPEDASSSESSLKKQLKPERKVKNRGNSSESFFSARSQPLTSPKIPNVEFENINLDNPSQKVIANDSPRLISKRNNSSFQGEEMNQSEAMQAYDQPVNNLIQASRQRQTYARSQIMQHANQQTIQSVQQMIDENGVRNVVRNSMNNRRTRDEVVEHATGMRKPEFHHEYRNGQSHRQRTPLAMQPTPQLNRMTFTQHYPGMFSSIEESKRELLQNLIAQSQSASVILEQEHRHGQQINQIIRASNGCQEEMKSCDIYSMQMSQQEEDELLNERSFENELQDDNNNFTTNESILINKVNEMQVKSSRFDNQRGRNLLRNPPMMNVQDQASLLHQLQISQHQRATQQNLLLTYMHQMQQQSHPQRRGLQASRRANEVELQNFEVAMNSASNTGGNLLNANSRRSRPSLGQVSPLPGQLNHLSIQRPCEQLPPSNIRGDVQSHIDAEEFNQNVEGVCSGLVPQQRIPLPNQQQQPLPRNPSQESSVNDPGEIYDMDAELAIAIENSRQSFRNQIYPNQQQLAMSIDDIGMDEFDVAEERQHMFGEQINPDIMTYEQLLALQERIGYVNKGMTVKEMNVFPQMKFAELKRHLKLGKAIDQVDLRLKKNLKSGNSEDLLENEEVKQRARDLPDQLNVQQPQSHSRVGGVHLGELRNYNLLGKRSDGHRRYLFEGEEKMVPKVRYIFEGEHMRTQRRYIFEGEESKSQLDNESILEKSLSSVLSFPNEMQVQYPNDFELPSIRANSRQMNEQQKRAYLFNSMPAVALLNHEEDKADLENAAPEKHHPREIKQSGPQRNQSQQVRASQPIQDIFSASRSHNSAQLESLDEENDEGSQEDVFDEGDDVFNRRLPHLANINGSIPNQHPLKILGFIGEQNQLVAQCHQPDKHQQPQRPRLSDAQAQILQEEQKSIPENWASSAIITPVNKANELSERGRRIYRSISQVSFAGELSANREQLANSARQPQISGLSTPQHSVMSSNLADVCIICQYQMQPEDTVKIIKPCNHYFHVNCVNQWLLVEKKCPLCMHSLC